MNKLHRRIVVLLPVLLFGGWFVIEQLPVWTAPPPPAERYPALTLLSAGCEAAHILARYDATADPQAPHMIGEEQAQRSAEAAIAEHVPGARARWSLLPQLMRADFDEGAAWIGLIALDNETAGLARSALVAIGAQSGEPLVLVMINGISADAVGCGTYTPPPQGLRARLRPYLPLIALAGYVGLAAAAGVVLPRLRRRS